MNKELLKDERMSMHAWRIRQGVIETAEDRGMRKAKVQITQKALALGIDWAFIAQITDLDMKTIERIAKGKKTDID